MTRKRVLGLMAIVVCLAAFSFASRKDEVTLVMVPREDGVVRVGMDIANRFPTLLMSYKTGANGAVSLHGWTGTEWVGVSLDDYQAGAFFRTGPDSALVVEKAGSPVPDSLVPPEAWCNAVYKITTTDLRPMLHLTGQYYDLKYKDWEWFSENYKLSMEAINPEGLNVAWYNKRLNENLKRAGATAGNDLQYWVALRHPVEVVVEEPPAETEGETDPEEQPEMETPEDPEVNPLTNAVPAAVVLGAGNAEEAGIADEPAAPVEEE
jgi:hypothetical protein